MKRTEYRNGDPVTLACGCDGCNPSMINGTLCHEAGCPEAWRDTKLECFECGCDYYPKERAIASLGITRICEDCANPEPFEIPADWECPTCGDHECPGCQPGPQTLSCFI